MEVKECKKCHQLKSVNDYYKKSKSPDGLQDYCKKCLNSYNQIRQKHISNNKRLALLKALSTYKLKHGLEYSFIEPKKGYHKKRNKITYKCLTCGKKITSTIQQAWDIRFDCCHKHNEVVKRNTLKYTKPNTQLKNKSVSINESLIGQLKKSYPNADIFITVTPTESIPNKTITNECNCKRTSIKKKGLLNWFKSLFR